MVGKIHVKQIYEIALAKHKDENLKNKSLESLCRCIAGSCNSMGLVVYGGNGSKE
jgi:ribosomal protein L11